MSGSGHFDTSAVRADLRGKSVRSGAAMLAAQGGKAAFGLASAMALARLLTPDDFGRVALVVVSLSFLTIFRDLGLPEATVRFEAIDDEQVSTLFWMNLALALLIFVPAAFLGPFFSRVFRTPGLNGITAALAALCIVYVLSLHHTAILRRRMRFVVLAGIQVAVTIVASIVGIIAAWKGMGVWALVLQRFTNGLVETAAVWIFCSWRPRLLFRFGAIRGMIRFGAFYTLSAALYYVSRRADRLLLGRFSSAGAVGLYEKSYEWLLLPAGNITVPIGKVALPGLCRLQDDPARFRSYFRRAALLVLTITVPLILFLAVDAPRFVLFLLGGQWIDAVPVFRFLLAVALTADWVILLGWVYIALGRTDREFRFWAVAAAVLVAAFRIGAPHGPAALAASFSAAQLLLAVPSVFYCFHGTPLRAGDFFGVFARPTIRAAAAAAALLLFRRFVAFDAPPAIDLAAGAALFFGVYWGAWAATKPGRETLRADFRLLRELRSPAPPSPSPPDAVD
ncbi:MAG: lipopolysaccharide biosynthesis protein [Candidatus Eisenbacteria bacterium]|nr:lipopolysaccharide biosynthesis protein [Candidatus Eisenbacteria bacterium]